MYHFAGESILCSNVLCNLLFSDVLFLPKNETVSISDIFQVQFYIYLQYQH